MPGFVAVLRGPHHVYEYVNDAYIAIAGPRNFVGNPIRGVFPELADQGCYERLDQVYSTGVPFSARAVPIRLTGEHEERFIDLLYEPIRDAQGMITGIFVGGYDVSEAQRTLAALRTSQATLRELNANLERQLAERSQVRDRTWQVTPDLMGALNSRGYFVDACSGRAREGRPRDMCKGAWGRRIPGWPIEEPPQLHMGR